MTTNLTEGRHDHHDDDGAEGDAPSEIVLDGVSRRTFLNIVGAGAALAGVGLSGCIRKPVTKIVPYATRPEDLVEGVPQHFASVHVEGVEVTGLVVEAHEGRPTKLAGNKAHPDNLGATSHTTQASVLDLYDLDRSTVPHGKHTDAQANTEGGQPSGPSGTGGELGWDGAWRAFDDLFATSKAKPIAFVVPSLMSPTMRRLLGEAKVAYPQARFFNGDLLWPAAAMAAAQAVNGPGGFALSNVDKADVLAAFDSDVLGAEVGAVRAMRGYRTKRKITGPNQPMSRIYAVEPGFTPTGATADHRARVKASDIGKALTLLATRLADNGVAIDATLRAALPAATELDANAVKLIDALAKDLAAHKSAALVTVGPRQPAWVHALGYAINAALGAGDGPQTWHSDATLFPTEGLGALAEALKSKAIDTVFALETNPAHTAPGELGLAALLEGVTLVHTGRYDDETGRRATLHLPASHYLEAWGDAASLSGAVSIQQPLIDPLHFTPSGLEVLARAVRGKPVGGHELVRETWKVDEVTWERWLNDGVRVVPPEAKPAADWAAAAKLVPAAAPAQAGGVEFAFELDPNLRDGRYANNSWLRELPHTMSKLTWDNAAYMNAKTANGLGNGAMIKATVGAASVELPVHVLPGVADGVVVITLGNGRRGIGKVAEQHGFDTFPLLPASAETAGWFAAGSFSATGDTIRMANVQAYGNSQTPRAKNGFGPRVAPETFEKGKGDEAFEPRVMALEATLAEYAKEPTFPDKIADRIMPDEKVKSWMYADRPNEKPLVGGGTTDDEYLNGVHQWGMSIDLNACTGCNACTIACQAENNIVSVGKDQVLKGREMHWIRIDRYFSGTEDEPAAALQPIPCMQCETAPCEAVCPVKATAHSNEGLNDMIYNRCVGTRYCSNNCPFKVRRYNWFNFNLDLHPLEQMQKNPDVTVRFRGVMEKCTYCVQRINRAKIEAKVHGDGRVHDLRADGTPTIETACQEVCPTDAIVFGDLKNPDSAVSKAKSEPRTYQLLRELNLRTRTTFLAKLRNPNPDLV